MAMKVSELKQILNEHHVNFAGLLEKSDLVDKIVSQISSKM